MSNLVLSHSNLVPGLEGTPESVQEVLVSNKLWYEKRLLVAAAKKPQYFMESLILKVNVASKESRRGKEYYSDFSKPLFNTLFSIFKSHYLLCQVSEEFTPVPDHWVQDSIETYRDLGKIGEEEVILIREMWAGIHPANISDDELATLEEIILPWLNMQRTKTVIGKHSMTPTSLSSVIEDLEAQRSMLVPKRNEFEYPDDIFEMYTDRVKEDQTYGTPVPLGLDLLDTVLDGGMSRGEVLLGIIPSGGGKTTLAHQIASSVAFNKLKVVLYTTEQPKEELFPRLYSSACQIPYSKIRRGIFPEKLQESEINQILEAQKVFKEYFRYADWSSRGDSSSSIMEHLDGSLNRLEKEEGFVPDVVIFDWLGGGIGAGVFKDSHMEISYYLKSMEHFSVVCKRRNFVGVIFTQADTAQAGNTKMVSSVHASRAKEVHQFATVGLGVSAIKKKTSDDTAGDAYEKTQWFNIFKSRNGPTRFFGVVRDFGYQRFRSP